MTTKVRENFFILVSSNIITVVVFLILILVWNEEANLQHSYNIIESKVFWITVVLFSSLITILLMAYTKKKSHIPESVQNPIPIIPNDNLSLIREEQIRIQEETRQRILSAINQYLIETLASHLSDEYLQTLITDVRMFEVDEHSTLRPVCTHGALCTIDLRHIAWNIGERLKWSGCQRAYFIKQCFPEELKDIEIETIRRNLRQKGACKIELDIPAKDSFEFHSVGRT